MRKMKISGNQAVVLCAVVICLQCVAVQNTILTSSSGGTPAPVECGALNLLSSTQFATLCKVQRLGSNLIDAITNLANVEIPEELLSITTADAICDADCRCVMGAIEGQCGLRIKNGTETDICQCNYKEPAVFNNSSALTLLKPFSCTIFPVVTELCHLSLFRDYACNADCQCSHGYENTGNHVCKSYRNGTFCVCENGTNIY